MTVPGVPYHPRSDWVEAGYPITGPTVNASAIDTAVIHYTAASSIPDDVAQFLRNTQRYYVNQRGYSLGYRWAVDQAGHVWQIRGWEHKSAANRNHNGHTEPIVVLVDGQDEATPAAVRGVQAVIAESQKRSGRTFRIVGHGDLDGASTSCPGTGLKAQIRAGVFTPTTPPEQDDDDMPLFAAKSNNNVVHIIDGVWRFNPPRPDVFLNMHHGTGRPVLDFATGDPVAHPDQVTQVDDSLIQGVAHNVKG